MKYSALIALSLVASASAFTPASNGRSTSALSAEKKPFFSQVFDLDLFAPVADVNDYGARKKKKIASGKITEKSYVPTGLSKAQYEKIRAAEIAKKEANYQKNAAKAGKFQDFTEWYKKRGTDISDAWIKGVTRGHEMVKTKYDWSGLGDKKLWATEE
jgi:hypothetical protein